MGCASLQISQTQIKLRQSLDRENYEQTLKIIEKAAERGVYRKKDEVLFNLEKGMIAYFADKHELSQDVFSQADSRMEELVTRSASRAAASIIGNDNQLDYDGDDHEQLYVNAFNSLNYLSLGDMSGALVEIRKMTFKLEQLGRRYGNALDNFKDNSYAKMVNWENMDISEELSAKSSIRNSAWARYLATILYAKSGDMDGARIEFEQLPSALRTQQDLAWGDFPRQSEIDQLMRPDSYNTLLLAYHGESPQKISQEYRDIIYLNASEGGINNVYIKFALPLMLINESKAVYADAVINDTMRVRLPLIEHMDHTAKAYFQYKKPTIYIRAITRSLAKTLGTEALKRAAKKEGEGAEFLASLFGFLFKEGSEQADLRSWQSMPAKVHAAVLKLPAGEHQVDFEYFNQNERLIYKTSKDLIVNEQHTLSTLHTQEALLWD